ncbi:E3 ubiquitin-protein ligase TM129-like isoform X1 [Temnothorax curvispinosus]|uniref:E3 ubiquitin-protein ligase TM129-like isoform X1 n=2 Tax=Temnothorax curvispinosus TaxID=300111 RepID=A0A6J1R4C8_9HYME|nr:E3 ubiquitin-protein ligase TM129-like isoform X1 [Temnothorax curvispinosus]
MSLLTNGESPLYFSLNEKMSAVLFYTLFYLLMSGCIIYPPTEFVSAGLTVKDVFANWLGSENEFFVQYHIRRSVATLLLHSALPLGYVLGLLFFDHIDAEKLLLNDGNYLGPLIVLCATIVPLYTLNKVFEWSVNNWATHPIAKNLSVYGNNNTPWTSVASDINTEYRRIDKIVIVTNSVTRVIATDNWIIKITPYKLQVAHQSDATLVVNKSDVHFMSPTTRDQVQFINIQVKPMRAMAQEFDIRLNALDFKDLQDKVSRPIAVLHNIRFHRTLLDRFIDTFKEEVDKNPFYDTAEELGQCIGCMQALSNVKLNRLCNSTENRDVDDCTTCFCRPMWCIECMAKWFASRQDEDTPETWLSSKCTCPLCRARFCVLDVCLVRNPND